MCGITGILHFDRERCISENLLKKMTNVLNHRGPDGDGYYIKNNIGLGHKRLSIIDLATGQQPMISDNGNIIIAYNGEIYNYIELKNELITKGFQFITKSDTEVIIKSYECWGIDFLNKLNGMWAFALWDKIKQKLILTRDRIGEKPLFYSNYDNSLIFGSEIKSILEYGIPKIPNNEFLEIYLFLGYIPAPYTFYKNISKLNPGEVLVCEANKIETYIYWNLPEIDESNMIKDKKFVYDEFTNLFRDSVTIRMRSDVDYGAFLSGGLDSSSVVAEMSEISKNKVNTFTIGFHEKEFDERYFAKLVANKFGCKYNERIIDFGLIEDSLDRVIKHYDEPFGDSSAIPTDIVSKYASEHVKMVLTGDGGDELQSGYTAYQSEKIFNKTDHFPNFIFNINLQSISFLKKLLKGNYQYKLNRIENVLESGKMNFEDRIIYKSAWVHPKMIKNMLKKLKCFSIEEYISDLFKKCKYKDNFYKRMYFNYKVSLPDDMLTKVDRMSMSNSLETRLPFLDFRLIEFMIKVDKSIKMDFLERKSILKNTIGRKLPKELLYASKKGFVTPLREWFKEVTFSQKLENLYKSDNLLDKNIIKKIVDNNKSGKYDNGNFIWMLLVLQKWYLNCN